MQTDRTLEPAELLAKSIDQVIDEGEQSISVANANGKPDANTRKRGAHPRGCTCGRCKWSRPGSPDMQPQIPQPSPAKVKALAGMFHATGKVVFNGMLGLEPEFTTESGQVLAEAWAPVLEAYSGSPLSLACILTAGVCAPYFAQIGKKVAQDQIKRQRARKNANVQIMQ